MFLITTKLQRLWALHVYLQHFSKHTKTGNKTELFTKVAVVDLELFSKTGNKTVLFTEVAVVDLELLGSVFAQRAEVSDATNRWHGLRPVILKTPIRLNTDDRLADLGTLNAPSTTNHDFDSRYPISAVMIQS